MSLPDRILARVARRLFSLPDGVARALAGGRRITIEGQELDARVQLMLALMKRTTPPFSATRTVAVARTDMARSGGLVAPPPRALAVSDRAVALSGRALPLRIYRRRDLAPAPPALVYFHGGGWVLGDIETHDGVCQTLADEARAVVVSVDYRLAPEHPWPAAPDDATAAYRWVHAHAAELDVDPARIAVGGDSAGGNLAAIVCLDAKADGFPPPRAQALIYPGLDMRRLLPSHRTFADGFLLTEREIDWFIARYLPAGERDYDHPRASPLRAEDVSGLPPALVVTAGFDPLRDEGRAYADRLESAGVTVRYRCHPSLIHGFVSFAGAVPAARAALSEVATWVRSTL